MSSDPHKFSAMPRNKSVIPKAEDMAHALGAAKQKLFEEAYAHHPSLARPDTVPQHVLSGGPFFIRATPGSAEDDDRILVGPDARTLPYQNTELPHIPGRSEDTPGLLSLGGFVKTFPKEETVDLWVGSSASWEDLNKDEYRVRLMCLRAWFGAEYTDPITNKSTCLKTDHTFLDIASVSDLSDWWDALGRRYFPLGWIRIEPVSLDAPGSGSSASPAAPSKYKVAVSQITWPCTAWALSDVAVFPVKVTASLGTHCECDVYSTTMDTVILSKQELRIWQLPSGYAVPVGYKLLAYKRGAAYYASTVSWP